MPTIPARVDQELFEAARAVGKKQSRSGAQQVEHWARIGREFERSPNVSLRDVSLVLAGKQPYDSLRDPEQAIVRAAWDEEIAERLSKLNLAAEFAAEADTWVEGDGTGAAVERSHLDEL